VTTELPAAKPGTVGSASDSSSVSAGGDIVGRDKITQVVKADDARLKNYIQAVREASRSIPRSTLVGIHLDPASRLESIYVDFETDALRAGVADAPVTGGAPRYSVLQALFEIPSLLLMGEQGSGKTTALRMFCRTATLDTPPRLIPIVLDASEDFGAWLLQQDLVQPSALLGFVYELWGLRLESTSGDDLAPVFLWDHAYVLNRTARLKLSGLIASLRRWFPLAHHVVTARNSLLQNDLLFTGFDSATILPLDDSKRSQLREKYSNSFHLDGIETRYGADTCWDFLSSSFGESDNSWLADLGTRCHAEGLSNDHVAAMLQQVPALCLDLLLTHPQPQSYFQVIRLLSGGHRAQAATADAMLGILAEEGLVGAVTDDEFQILNAPLAEQLSLSAIEQDISKVLGVMESTNDLSRIVELVERAPVLQQAGALDDRILRLLARREPNDDVGVHSRDDELRVQQDVDVLRLALAVGARLTESPEARVALVEVTAAVQEHALRAPNLISADALGRVAARGRALLTANSTVLEFRKVGPGMALVNTPGGTKGEPWSGLVEVSRPIWLATAPVSNAQFSLLLPHLAAEVDHGSIVKVRPEVWRGSVGDLRETYREDPLVGITFSEACVISSAIGAMAEEKVGHLIQGSVPTIAEWGLIDTGRVPGSLYNERVADGGPRRPVACGLTGFNQSGFTDVYGNVMEWTRTSWGSEILDAPGHLEHYNPGGPWDDPEDTGFRLLRGGSWLFREDGPRCACVLPREARFPDVGLRPCLVFPADVALSTPDVLVLELR
jgi:hypothetical protein